MKSRYLHLTSLAEGLEKLHERFSFTPRFVEIPVDEALGRVTAQAVYAPFSVPAGHLSAMDGIAVKSGDTHGATDQKPVCITDYLRVNTGNLIPAPYDAVIMIEDAEESQNGFLIRKPAYPWQHIRPVGEDIASGEMILPRGHTIKSGDIGAMLSYGITTIPVLSLQVALIPTGSEIVPIGTVPKPGQVIESNMHMAAAAIRQTGADVTIFPIIPDDPDQIRTALAQAVRTYDVVLVSAGSSKGTKDFTSSVIRELGTVFVHGLAIKPAKPVIFGDIEGKPVIGMPGYPIACHTIIREIIHPLLSWYGLPIPQYHTIHAKLAHSLVSDLGIDEFVLVTVGKIQESWVALPQSRGSGIQMSLVRSHGHITIPASQEGVEAGTEVAVTLDNISYADAQRTILITGSHDPILDCLADRLRPHGIFVASVHLGSMGGLLALKRGDCHLAPMHLLAEDGAYNVPFLTRYLPNEELILVCVAEREQGIVSREGLAFDAITSHRFINRQKGSGTRMLLDFLLKKHNVSPESIHGYEREVTTHIAVCLAVLCGDADLGIAVHSAAKAYDLAFVPIGTERYELVMRAETYASDPHVQHIVSYLQSDDFKNLLTQMGGYRTENMGVIRRIPSS